MRTPPSRASPRLAALKNSPLPLSPTSVLRPKKLLVLALAVPKPMLPPVTPVQKDLEPPILEIPRVPKMRRTARIRLNDSETSKGVEDDNMEFIAMDEPFVQVEEVEEEEEEEDPEEDPEKEEGEVEYFRDEEDYGDYFFEEDDDSSDGSTGSN
ncbi:hypothetical protein PIB30_084359 [Stylosanthes scabra]|uniref:Uncharacterized protein n=1 Tax=Stylosanthes scabra TaxID=79078 RepID=A0ABU6ZR28_9FABA|nr:hypothetical protein [Stylosanthes scabra]